MLKRNQFYSMEAIEWLSWLDTDSVGLIATDLPYGVLGGKHAHWDKVIDASELWQQVWRVLRPGGVFVTTATEPFASHLRLSTPHWRYDWVYVKSNVARFLDVANQPLQTHEMILVFYEKNGTYNPIMENGKAYTRTRTGTIQHVRGGTVDVGVTSRSHGKRYPRSVYYYPMGNTGKIHVNQKPLALYEDIITMYSNPDDVVIDPCCGSGTTAIAAMRTGRDWLCNDLIDAHTRAAKRRIEAEDPYRPHTTNNITQHSLFV